MTSTRKEASVVWTGIIPNHWRHVRLGSLFLERNEPVTAESSPPLSVTKAGVVEQQEQVAKSKTGAPKKLAHCGDFVINSRSDRKGSAGLAPRDGSVSVINIVLEPKSVVPQFAHYLLRSAAFQEEFYRWGTGIVDDLWSTRYSAMKNILLPLPTEPEQESIADYLDHETAEIDAFIADLREMAHLQRERADASIETVFGQMSSDFPSRKLGWDFRVGNGATPKSDRTDYWNEGEIPWVNSSVVNDWIVKVPSRMVTEIARNECHLPIVPAGSVLVGLTGQGKTRGKVTVLGFDSTINQHMAFIAPRSREAVSTEFLRYMLVANYEFLRFISDAGGSTKGALTCADLTDFRVPAPPDEVQRSVVIGLDREQAAFAEGLSDIERAIELAKERRAALISAAVTGQIDVTKKHRPAAEQLEDEVSSSR